MFTTSKVVVKYTVTGPSSHFSFSLCSQWFTYLLTNYLLRRYTGYRRVRDVIVGCFRSDGPSPLPVLSTTSRDAAMSTSLAAAIWRRSRDRMMTSPVFAFQLFLFSLLATDKGCRCSSGAAAEDRLFHTGYFSYYYRYSTSSITITFTSMRKIGLNGNVFFSTDKTNRV